MTVQDEDAEMPQWLLADWKHVRKLTYDLAKAVPISLLNKKVGRPIYDTMGKQMYEMAIMQGNYTDVLAGKKPDFSKTLPKNFSVTSKDELKDALKTADKHFYEAVAEIGDWYDEKYDVMGNYFSAYNIIGMLIGHETFHQGQFAALGYILEINFPSSWAKEWQLHFR